MNRDMVRDIVNLKRDVSQVNNEIPDGTITLRRTAVQAITTAGTIIVWQSIVRGNGITASGSNITIQATGWYALSMAWFTSATVAEMYVFLYVNGTLVQGAASIGAIATNNGSAMFMRFFRQGDTVQIALRPSANVNLTVRAEGTTQESPFLNIVQLTNEP